MSALFPVAEYAEDQRFAGTILTTHVLHRGFQSGAVVGAAVGALRKVPFSSMYSSIPRPQQKHNAITEGAFSASNRLNTMRPVFSQPASTYQTTSPARQFFSTTTSQLRLPSNAQSTTAASAKILRSTGVGSVVGLSAMAIMLPMMMRGKEEIEWQDRSYRLLHNKGQVAVDTWSLIGMTTAIGIGAFRDGSVMKQGWKVVAGRLGAGSLIGVGAGLVTNQLTEVTV
ncbi:hypothetical protein LTR10_014294 [Elasticomyces elasticus]|uniref:Uncharacterized protein n=1 Tax=Exophiala sideris TaxID=1016849 RepID=A0ABR0JIY6_9EURO|nr:hypothetical protein LTR10_014294 [Elasticomyces elasticus]KAK5034336.1 hypothetical protein LTS07_003256 [Exophiala sideris]KAK5042633.1 hypothetical protein LTR13_001480 [Exophiala sideris]KAK5065715.1 hypothetical protein LTR69_003264 [Exophiala sideris]KAK5185825.1 hypothetical protein LTR44_001874 [Eurotiomycetes sp. CCFEE 6388]